MLYRNIDRHRSRFYKAHMIELHGGTLDDLKGAARRDPEGQAVSYRGEGIQVELWFFAKGDGEAPEDEYRFVVCDNGKYRGCFEADVIPIFQ